LRSVPAHREHDAILLELSDTENPVGLAFFGEWPGVPQEVVVQSNFSLLRLIFREHWSPTRMEDAVFAITATLCGMKGATLLDVSRLLTRPTFRRRALAGLKDLSAREFWGDYEALSESAQREMARPILNRLRAFYRSPAVRHMVCQKNGINFQRLMDKGAILLVSLAGQEIQAEADLLGELILARLHLAAMSRLTRQAGELVPCYIAVDESHRYKGASLPTLLREGRKLATPLILSSQYIDSWGEELVESILGNVGTLIAFRCGSNDSRRLSASLRPFTADQLEDLDRYEAIAKMQVGGATMPAFRFSTLPIEAPANEEMLERVRSRTRRLYTRPRREVEAEMDSADGQVWSAWSSGDVYEE
jgi:hypothetical protein